jgi:hypothetical protein
VRVTGETASLDPALNRVRAELDALATRGVSSAEKALVTERYRVGRFERSQTPRGRVARLWRGETAEEFRPEMLSPHLKSLQGSAHRIIEVNVKD